MFVDAIHVGAFLPPLFPAGSGTRWETEYRAVWNEREQTSEERELVYEISWIAELGAWRRFLRSQRRREVSEPGLQV
jgi:hypothetical protein